MEITCAQMDVLLSFYIEGDLSKTLKSRVENHLKTCATCRAKYNIVKNMLDDLNSTFENKENMFSTSFERYNLFQNNLSAYVDNELPTDESIKIKKYTINNKEARKQLEDVYNIRRLMSESFQKTKLESKQDFSKNILKQITPVDDYNFSFHPVLKIAIAFVITVLTISSIVLFILIS